MKSERELNYLIYSRAMNTQISRSCYNTCFFISIYSFFYKPNENAFTLVNFWLRQKLEMAFLCFNEESNSIKVTWSMYSILRDRHGNRSVYFFEEGSHVLWKQMSESALFI